MSPAGATLRLFAEWLRPTTIHGGQIFSVPLFLSLKALFLRASAFFLADAVGRISLAFVLRECISLFFLS
jgi:hypothetical protein